MIGKLIHIFDYEHHVPRKRVVPFGAFVDVGLVAQRRGDVAIAAAADLDPVSVECPGGPPAKSALQVSKNQAVL